MGIWEAGCFVMVVFVIRYLDEVLRVWGLNLARLLDF